MKNTLLLFAFIASLFASCSANESQHNTISSTTTDSSEFIQEVVPQTQAELDLPALENQINEIIQLIVDDQAATVSTKYTHYPIERSEPLPFIQNKETFELQFELIFDADLKRALNIHLTDQAFINLLDKNGEIGIADGMMWFNNKGELTKIMYSSFNELEELAATENQIRYHMHPILKNYEYNTYIGQNSDYLIRIDQLKREYRLAAWRDGQTMEDEPDFILKGGTLELLENEDESGRIYRFSDGFKTCSLKRVTYTEKEGGGGDFFTNDSSSTRCYEVTDPFEVLNN